MTITVRPVGPQDRTAWLPLWRGYQRFYQADLTGHEDWLWSRLMAPGEDGPFGLVAVEGTDLVGLAHYLFHGSSWSPRPRCYLNDLFTDEAARGRGVGRRLIEAVYDEADRRGASPTYWLTQSFNRDARALYDRVARETPFIKYER